MSLSAFSAAADSLLEDVVEQTPESLLEAIGRLYIRSKDRREVLFQPNAVQRDIARQAYAPKTGPTKLLVLKARQVGVSTFSQAWSYALTTSTRFARAVTVSHEADATVRLATMQRFFLSRDERHPSTSTNRIGEVTYKDTEATHYIGTAGSKTFGRGDTLHFIHCSELAFWDHADTLLTGLLQALTPDGTVIIESTPNGLGGEFYELWQNAPANGWTPLFYPWWWEAEYRIHIPAESVLPYTPIELQLVAEHGLSHEQIAWRREKQKELRDKFAQEYPENPIDCFLASGRPYFSAQGLKAQEAHLREPIEDDGRGLQIWARYDPAHRYAIPADPAEGLEGGDFSVAHVLDLTTGEQVARLRGHWPTDHFAKILGFLGAQYGFALLAPERNNHGHAVINTLRGEVKYPNIYRHHEYDPLMQTDERERWGYPTNTTTKPVMLSDLDAALIDESGIKIRDAVTLGELRTMHWDGKGGVNAIAGCHDDTVISLAIGWQLRKQPSSYQVAEDFFNDLERQERMAREAQETEA